MKIELGAVIPTIQYGNIQPKFEVEAESIEAGLAIIEPQIKALYDKYSDKPLVTHTEALGSTQDDFVEVEAFVGGKIWYSASRHEYRNDKGEVYLSGSQYASSFDKPFDAQSIAGKMATKSGVPAQDILKMWEMKRDISNGLGSAIHASLELYGKYLKHSEAFDKSYHIHDNPIIKPIVESFYAGRNDNAEHEVMVVDHKRKYAGQIDYLKITGEKRCVVGDFKTGTDMPKNKQEGYFRQLSFYGSILEASGWAVEGLEIYHLNGGWATHKSPMLEVV